MAATHVYHWKHGWIPLTHAAAMSKAKGNSDAAKAMLTGVSHSDLRRSPHIMAAKAPRGRIALLDKKTGHTIGLNESHAASFHDQGHTITSVNPDGTFTTRSDAGQVNKYGPDGRLVQPKIDHVDELSAKRTDRAAQTPREIHDRLIANPSSVSMDELQRLSRLGGKFAAAANAEIARRDGPAPIYKPGSAGYTPPWARPQH